MCCIIAFSYCTRLIWRVYQNTATSSSKPAHTPTDGAILQSLLFRVCRTWFIPLASVRVPSSRLCPHTTYECKKTQGHLNRDVKLKFCPSNIWSIFKIQTTCCAVRELKLFWKCLVLINKWMGRISSEQFHMAQSQLKWTGEFHQKALIRFSRFLSSTVAGASFKRLCQQGRMRPCKHNYLQLN